MVCKQPHVSDLQNTAAMMRKACMCDFKEGVSCEAAAMALEKSLMVLHSLCHFPTNHSYWHIKYDERCSVHNIM